MSKLPRYLADTIESLPNKFQMEDFREAMKRRSREFTPRSLLLTMIQLVGSKGKEGYDHALTQVFGVESAPRKGALSYIRSQVSSKFFLSILSKTISGFDQHRPMFNGLIVYAVDGWQVTLPRSEDVVKAGYTGRATAKYRESYMPKGFITHAVDVLSETTKCASFNSSQTELADALTFIGKFESNSVTLYDRAYFSNALCKEHFRSGNYFIARCQKNANAKVSAFFANADKESSSMYINVDGAKKRVWLFKILNEKTDEVTIFATNLPRRFRNQKTLDQLYQLRWSAETSFYELSETIKLQQWHTKSFDGILQEIYTALLVINLTKILSFFAQGQRHINPEKATYRKPNFKLLMNHFIQFVITSRPQLSNLLHRFMELIRRSTEKRKRRSRSHPREIRSPASPYPRNNTEWLWDKAHSLI